MFFSSILLTHVSKTPFLSFLRLASPTTNATVEQINVSASRKVSSIANSFLVKQLTKERSAVSTHSSYSDFLRILNFNPSTAINYSVSTFSQVTLPVGYGVFAGGVTSPMSGDYPTNAVDKYFFLTNTVTVTSSLGANRENLSSAGNYSVGIFTGGDPYGGIGGTGLTDYTDKFQYSNDTVTHGTNLPYKVNESAGAGIATHGVFAGGGLDPAGLTALSNKYTYSNDVITSGQSLSIPKKWLSAAANHEVGYYAGGFDLLNALASTDKYNYVSDTIAPSVNLSTATFAQTGTGNNSMALMAAGQTTGSNAGHQLTTQRMYYASDISNHGSNLGVARNQLAGASNSNLAVFAGGVSNNNPYQWTDVYVFTGDVVTSGTFLNVDKYCLAATSNTPGGFFA